VSVGDALDKLEISAPDLIISETKFSTELDGFELRRRLRAAPEWAEIPFIFLTAETAIENKIKGLELGVDDYLTKPIYIKEIVTRINILLQKRQRQFLDLKKDGTRFAGRVADMPVVDVIQTIEVSRKSGVIQFTGPASRQAAIYFRDGKVIDAEAGTLQGEDAVYRLLTWNEGEFEVEFRTVRRREAIATSSQGLLMEGMRRLDEWSRLLEQLPPLSHRFEIDAGELAQRLGEIPDDNNRILRLFDGKRTLLEVIDASDFGDLECLQAISRLYFEGLLTDLDPGVRSRRDTGKPMPLAVVDGVPTTPIEEVVSGPIGQATGAPFGAADPSASRLSPASGSSLAPASKASPSSASGSSLSPASGSSLSPASGSSLSPASGSSLSRASGSSPASPAPSTVAAAASRPSYEDVPVRARRDSGEIVRDSDVVEEEEIHGPLSGGFRPSSLRLIDEAVAAAQAIEPSLFDAEELAALGLGPPTTTPTTEAASTQTLAAQAASAQTVTVQTVTVQTVTVQGSSAPAASAQGSSTPAVAAQGSSTPAASAQPDTPLARIKVARTATDPRIENARSLVERSPVLADSGPVQNGTERRKPPTQPPPVPRRKLTEREIADAPLLDADPYTSGEHDATGAREIADAPFVEAEPDASGEHTPASSSSGVPMVIDADSLAEADALQHDSAPRRFAATIRRETSQGMRIIGSHGRDRAEASGEVTPPPERHSTASDSGEPQRELITILPRRATRENPIVSADGLEPTVETALAEPQPGEDDGTDATASAKSAAEIEPTKPAKPAVEPPSRPPPPPRRVTVEGGVVRSAGPGRGAMVLIGLTSILAGATVYSYVKKPRHVQPAAAFDDAAVVAGDPPPDLPREDHTEHGGFGIDASVAPHADVGTAVTPRPDGPRAERPRTDAATLARDAAVATTAAADAAIDKTKEARALYEKGHETLEDGDAEGALALLDESLKLRKTARTYLERARALVRLNRIDDAVASIDSAIALNASYAPAYEQKGMILWSAQRYAEARPVLQKYLELDPDGRKAATIRAMLDEPR